MRKPFLPVILFFLFFFVLFNRQSASADCRLFPSLIHNGGFAVANSKGRVLSSCNENIPFIPASIIKIPLALAALDILGADFRFFTEFYIDEQRNIYIKGYGDPFLISEEITIVLDRLREKGVNEINEIFFDTSAMDLEGQVPGRGKSDNPYDVPVSSVAVNFNTIHILVHEDGRIVSAEPQTPTLPLMKELGKALPAGQYRINICQSGCNPEKQSARYAGELFRALLKRNNIAGSGRIERRKVPAGASLVYRHENSKNLQEVVSSFLEYSNNFVANQVFLQCGVQRFGFPATWEKGKKSVSESLGVQLGNNISRHVHITEGSGLSRNNSVTANAMLRILDKFKPYADLMQEKNNVTVKSGTLEGVYNYAGYLANDRSFVILLNQKENTRDSLLEKIATQY